MEDVFESTIRKYLPRLSIKRKPLRLKNLPVVYRGLYDFEELFIYDQPFLLIKVKSKELGPKDFKKHSRTLKASIDHPQVWGLKELHPHKVRRMIENEMNFVVADKQVHLPAVSISIRADAEKVNVIEKLSGLSVNILIREILKKDVSGKSKAAIAELFKVSNMTAGRALEPLLHNELCEEHRVGVAKEIEFRSRAELWLYVQKQIKTPVKETVYLGFKPKALPYSGISALSQRSMLSDDEIPTFAIDKKKFNEKFRDAELVHKDDAVCKIEIWDRSVTLVEGSVINAVDNHLVLKEDLDERVRIELDKMLKGYGLGVSR